MRNIVWIRGKDLRLQDHPAVRLAGPGALFIFVVDPYFFDAEAAKRMPHRMQFLVESLQTLESEVARRGGKLWFVEGKSVEVVPRIARAFGAPRVLAMRWTEPFGRERDRQVAEALDVPLVLLEGETLLPPGTLRTQGGSPYSVFTPFSRRFRQVYEGGLVLEAPSFIDQVGLPAGVEAVSCPTLSDLGLPENSRLLSGGEVAAQARLQAFVEGAGSGYVDGRNRMDLEGTSRISADIKFGLLSPREVWCAVMESAMPSEQKACFTNELIWREFNYSTLWDRPDVLNEPFKAKWKGFPWRVDSEHWMAWATGMTGYPVVDAAARQLLATGFVHNRARMIAASFLTKHLRLDYRLGEAHYMRWLTDGDWAQNNMGWQWAAGSGADAQPWFRIFNPVRQGRKFDPDGDYVRRWVPELAGLETKYIHAPWEAPEMVCTWAGISLGQSYPHPVVDHASARDEYLSTAKSFLSSPEAQAESAGSQGAPLGGDSGFSPSHQSA